jgi:hypothetical protein
MQAQPSTFQGPSLVANIPTTITKFDDARPLVELIDRLVPPYMREEVPELAPLPLALKRMDDANGTDDDELRQRLEAEILRIYGPARDELQRFLAGSSGGAPKAIQAVASSHTTPLTQAPLGPPAIGGSPIVTSAPCKATKNAILKAAPNVFQLARMSTGAAATLFEFIRRWKLYVELGFNTMREYAARHLGVNGSNYREYDRAGKAMWAELPESASRVIEYLCGVGQTGPGAIAPPVGLPSVPSVSVLRVLPRALRQTDPSERAALVARVEAGECTYDELRKKGKESESGGQPAFSTAPANDDVAIARTESDESRQDGAADRPDIFGDVPEFEEFVRLARQAIGFLDRLNEGWSESSGRDVDPIRPRVRAIAEGIGKFATEIDDTIIPRTVCSACAGANAACTECRGMGWLPRVPVRNRPAKKGVKRAKAIRQKSPAVGSKKKSGKKATK